MVRPRRLRRVVALGGGTGLPAVLRALRSHLPRKSKITAVVTATDDGGSSGVLRREYGVLPPGDIRNCLIALAHVAPPEVTAALQCRLPLSSGPDHAVGNLLLTALGLVAADDVAAIRFAGNLLRIEDVVLPSTTVRAHLAADLENGRRVHGESAIPQSGARVLRLSIDPPDVSPAPGVLAALAAADAVILGPGSLYTSILATLVIPGIAAAIAAAPGAKIFVCNLMTERGETEGYGVAAHLDALAAHGLPPEALDYVLLNNGPIQPKVLARYIAEGAGPVRADFEASAGRPLVVAADLVEAGPVARHNPHKLGPLLCALGAEGPRRRSSLRPVRRRGRRAVAAVVPDPDLQPQLPAR